MSEITFGGTQVCEHGVLPVACVPCMTRELEAERKAHEETKTKLENYEDAWKQGAATVEEADEHVCQDSMYSVLDILDVAGSLQKTIADLKAECAMLHKNVKSKDAEIGRLRKALIRVHLRRGIEEEE